MHCPCGPGIGILLLHYMNAIFDKGSTFNFFNGRINAKTVAVKMKKNEKESIIMKDYVDRFELCG